MRLIVLAAGKGSRLAEGKNEDSIRKGLVDGGDGRPLMFHAARNMADFIDEIWVVTGKFHCTYRAAYEGFAPPLRLIRNYFWNTTGNLSSLWLALASGAGDKPYIIMNSDVVVSRGGISRLVAKATEHGEAAGIFERIEKPITKHDYAGVACVISEEARSAVDARVHELMRHCELGSVKWTAFGHWDVFYRDRAEVKADPFIYPSRQHDSFGETGVILSPNEISEIDTQADLAEHYRLLAAGMKNEIIRRDSA